MSRFALVVIVLGALTVVSIVLYPIVAIAPTTDHRPRCLSHLKQSALSLIMYTTDWNDRFPNRDRWVDATLTYGKNEEIYRCPEIAKVNPKQYGYAFNAQLSLAKIPQNEDTFPMVYDSVNLAKNASDSVNSLPNPPRHSDGKVNYMAYADGRVKPLKAKE